MKTSIRFFRGKQSEDRQEEGQSLVLIALILVILLMFVGIAVDVGFIFARGSQLQAAVDSAVLSGVPELIQAANLNDTSLADIKAGQFLNANGIPITDTTGPPVTFGSSRDLTELGVTEYSVTVTWPVELFFLRLLRDAPVNLRRSATAGINILTDIYASRRVQDGTVSTSTQGIFGPQICTQYGDPFSPWGIPPAPPSWSPGPYTYRYRILIPEDYDDDVVRVELFDPDSINRPNDPTGETVIHTSNARAAGLSAQVTLNCGGALEGGNPEQKNPCVLQTGENTPVVTSTYTIDQINPFWFVRIDENRGDGAGNGEGFCVDGQPASYTTRFNTQTLYQLYYYRESAGGQPVRRPIANYTGYSGDPAREALFTAPPRPRVDHQFTDMRWVSPGADKQGNDYPIADVAGVSEVPTDEGNTSFEVKLADLPDIIVDAASGASYLWLDVTSLSGASENGFEIWAGPDDYVDTTSTDVNLRNLAAINTPGSHDSRGVAIFAIGRLPLNSIYPNPVDIPLVYVGPELAGATMTIALFDTDSGVTPPITFFFDSINRDDWSMTFSDPGVDDPDGVAAGTRCNVGGPNGDNCDNLWITPPYQITIPGDLSNCDYAAPTMVDCTPFYGGRVMVEYDGGEYDTYGWQIQLSGLPYLIR